MILNSSFYVEAFVGSDDGVGEERFGFTVCTPRWLAAQVTTHGARFGHSYILLDFYDYALLKSALEGLCQRARGSTWRTVAAYIGRYGQREWEGEGY